MHQTTREFFVRMQREKQDSKFALCQDEAHKTITVTSVRYLMLCFTSPEPDMRDSFSRIKTWGLEDFQQYARYVDKWLLINYALLNLKSHHDLCGQMEVVSQHVDSLIKELTKSPWSNFLGNWMACHLGRTKSARDFVRGMASWTPLQHISSKSTSEDFKYNILDAAAALGLLRVVESLLLPCTQFDSQASSQTPLIVCARKGLVDTTRVLIDRNEDVDAKDNAGQTALHHAAENGHEPILHMLLIRGADKTIKDNHGLIALQLALKKL